MLKFCIIVWPLVVIGLAAWFNRKQNGNQPWTGGPISWPKSFWLAYTTTTWFFFPLLLITHEQVPWAFKPVLIVHLFSWWLRGPLELVMIYKWYNWSPRYGISHDLFHILLCSGFLWWQWPTIGELWQMPWGFVALIFIGMILLTTSAEILFAVLFLLFRSAQEAKENIYFASDDPKWIFINRVTLSVVIVAMAHLFWQSSYVWRL